MVPARRSGKTHLGIGDTGRLQLPGDQPVKAGPVLALSRCLREVPGVS